MTETVDASNALISCNSSALTVGAIFLIIAAIVRFSVIRSKTQKCLIIIYYFNDQIERLRDESRTPTTQRKT